MGQVTIYLDEETEKKMKAAAQAAGLSYSKWVAKVIQDKARNDWPEQVAALAGAWCEGSSADDAGGAVDRVGGEDIAREPF